MSPFKQSSCTTLSLTFPIRKADHKVSNRQSQIKNANKQIVKSELQRGLKFLACFHKMLLCMSAPKNKK